MNIIYISFFYVKYNNHIHRPRVSDVTKGKKFKLCWHRFNASVIKVELELLTLKQTDFVFNFGFKISWFCLLCSTLLFSDGTKLVLKFSISGNLILVPKLKFSFWISELISFHMKTIAKHMVLVMISGMLKLLVLMLFSTPLKFQISFQYSWNFVFSSVTSGFPYKHMISLMMHTSE